MKSILLASASLVGFAGAAAAEVTFGGTATLGYNDVVKDGFYWEGDLAVTLSQQLNNGLTAAASFSLNITDDNLGNDDTFVVDGNWVMSISSETAALTFGDTDQAAEKLYAGVDGMDFDAFAEDNIGDAILRGDVTLSGFDVSVSYNVSADEDLVGLQLGAAGNFGNFGVTFGYQDDSFPEGEIFGISGNTTFSGAAVTVGFSKNTDYGQSIGIAASYPVGPVTVSAYVAMNTPDVGDSYNNYGIGVDYASGPFTVGVDFDVEGDDDGVFAIEGTYAATEAILVRFGVLGSGDAYYVGAEMDLGSDSTFLVTFADDGDDLVDNDEIGDPEYLEGMTAELTLAF